MPSNPNTDTHHTNTFKVKANSNDVVTFNQSSDSYINLVAGSNITLTPDTSNKKITIASTA